MMGLTRRSSLNVDEPEGATEAPRREMSRRDPQASDKWSDDRIELLKALWAEGLSCNKIARKLGNGHTRCSVIGKVRRLGLPRRPKPVSTRKTKTSGQKRARPNLYLVKGGRKAGEAPHSPRATVKAETWQPLLGSAPRHFIERQDWECNWPLDIDGFRGEHRCCLPIVRGQYCEEHARKGYQPQTPKLADLLWLARRAM